MLAGRSVSRGTLLQDQTMEGSTLPPPLLSLLLLCCDMVLHILLLFPVRRSVCMNPLYVYASLATAMLCYGEDNVMTL